MTAGPDSTFALTRRALVGGAAAGVAAAPLIWPAASAQTAPAQAPPAQPPPITTTTVVPDLVVTGSETLGTMDLRNDPEGRVSTEVMLNGKGPFRFFVDTGANRSALTASTAARVGAAVTGEALVHGISGAEMKPMAMLKSLRCGVFEQTDSIVPILSDELLQPAAGMLGMDRFAGLRLEFDNTTREMTVKRSVRPWNNALSVPASFRFGQLVSAKGRIGGITVPIVFDTGAEFALANTALRDAIQARAKRIRPTRVVTATMPVFVENLMIIPQILLPNCTISDTTAYIDDFHIFKLWDLADQPALIVGMQVLRTVKRFAIDYKRKEVQFLT